MENTTTSATTPGPGAYQMGQVRHHCRCRQHLQAANISARMSRSFLWFSSAQCKASPEPCMQAIDALKRRKAESVAHSSVFASRTARLATDKAHDGKPG